MVALSVQDHKCPIAILNPDLVLSVLQLRSHRSPQILYVLLLLLLLLLSILSSYVPPEVVGYGWDLKNFHDGNEQSSLLCYVSHPLLLCLWCLLSMTIFPKFLVQYGLDSLTSWYPCIWLWLSLLHLWPRRCLLLCRLWKLLKQVLCQF